MKKEYSKPTIVIESLLSQNLICVSKYYLLEPDEPNIEAGARSFGSYDFEPEEESDNYFGCSF